MESALIELRLSTFEVWLWKNGDRVLEARFQEEVKQKEESSDAEGPVSASDDDKHGWMRQPPWWDSTASSGERAMAREPVPLIPDLVIQLIASLLRCTEMAVKYVRGTFRWPLREASALRPNPLPADYHDLCPSFNLGVATQYAQNSNIPVMVQAIFYAMVVNDAVELGVTSRLSMECMMWVMQQLD
ncbi:hypothetical protein Cgig2_018954 [Carnegiea gigantea]|uniref:Uncharacterized protein n=1 Tax=Carnegiea gigantea TaxID=171969 RepID=A0A9Q1GLR1_9CARY|nr:hypothetical protein Cgig2_018954 [Carnegiea gigantea]